MKVVKQVHLEDDALENYFVSAVVLSIGFEPQIWTYQNIHWLLVT